MRLRKYFYLVVCAFAMFFCGNAIGQVSVASSDSITCTNPCTTLRAYVVGDTPTDAGVTEDDIYSTPHAIGFSFAYYGTTYTQCVLGANGTIDFNLSDAGMFDPWPIGAALLGNTSKLNNICGPWCDIDIFYTGTPVGTETYSTSGIAPFRRFAVTWCGCSMFQCGTQQTTSQIILYETTNIIEVHIAQKPVCSTWNGGAAIVGVQNATGTDATVAPGRDYPSVWTIPPTEAWRFRPVTLPGGAVTYSVTAIPYAPIPYASSAVYWYNETTHTYMGTGDTVHVCPAVLTTYKAGAIGCGADTSWGYYTLNPSGAIIVTTTKTNPSFCGLCDGSIVIHNLLPGLSDTVTYDYGGVPQPPIIATVLINGTIELTGLCSGAYTNIKVHQGGCVSLPVSVTLNDPAIAISAITTTPPTLCGGCNGTLTLHGLYPVHAFTVAYNFNGTPQPPVAATSTGTGTITLTGLCAGIYSNIVASFGACVTPPAGPDTIFNPPIAISGVTPINATACGVCDGKLVLAGLYPTRLYTVAFTFSGVAQPPRTAITNSAGALTLTGLCAGVYNNIVASFGDCVTPPVGPYTITDPPPPVFNITGSSRPSGCHVCDGTITISGVPPTMLDTIFYSYMGGTMDPLILPAYTDGTLHLDGLCAGAYTTFFVKVGPCLSPVIGRADLPDTTVVAKFDASVHLGCHGDSVLFTNKSTSFDPLFYEWNFGDSTTSEATNPMHIFAQGVYTVTLLATNHHCTDVHDTVISLIHPLKAAFGASPTLLCQNTPVIFSDSSIGTQLKYAWSFGDGATSVIPNNSHVYTRSGQYLAQLIVTDFVPCHDTADVQIQVDSLSPLVLNVTDTVFCSSDAVTFSGKYTSIGNTGITWNFGDGDSVLNQNPIVHAFGTPGVFTVSATAHYRICADASNSKVVTMFQSPSVYLGADTTICPGGIPLELRDHSNAANPNVKWKWNTGQVASSIMVTAPGVYWVDASMDGCHTVDSINIINDCYMNIPNVFTPNGDGMNDYFFPRQYLTRGLTSFKMSIYNRWGQLVFETTSTNGAGWDGKFNDVAQPSGVYVYEIDATFKDGQKEHHQGNVTLLR